MNISRLLFGIMTPLLLASGCGTTLEEAPQPARQEAELVGCTPYSITRSSGVADGYSTANGTEPPYPSSGLRQFVANNYYYSTIRNHDSYERDRFFAHTYTGLAPQAGAYVCGATLTMRVYRGDENDGFNLLFANPDGSYGSGGYWYRRLSDLGVALYQDKTVTLNLAQLTTSTGQSLLPTMSSKGFLDMYVQDDSAVDFTSLQVQYCCPSPGYCGDGTCGSGETASSCPQDCDWCGNGYCGPYEDSYSCNMDCGGGGGGCTSRLDRCPIP